VRPSLESLQRARSFTIERFFIDHNSRNMERIRERLKQIRKAVRVDKSYGGRELLQCRRCSLGRPALSPSTSDPSL